MSSEKKTKEWVFSAQLERQVQGTSVEHMTGIIAQNNINSELRVR